MWYINNDSDEIRKLEKDKSKATDTVASVLYYMALFIFLIKRLVVDVTLWGEHFSKIAVLYEKIDYVYYNYVVTVLIVCIILKIFTRKPQLLFILFSVFMYIWGKEQTINHWDDPYNLIASLLIAAGWRENAKRIIIFILSVNVPILAVTAIASQFGIIENRISTGRVREYLGYNWTTTPVMIFAYVVFMFILIKKGKLNLLECAAILSVNYWFFAKTNTRFAFLIVTLTALFFLLFDKLQFNKASVLTERVFPLVPIIAFLFIFILALSFNENSSVMLAINRLLSNRLRQCNYSWHKYGITPWGQAIRWVDTMYSSPDNPATYVDPAYLQILIKYGWVSLLTLLSLSIFILKKTSAKRNYCFAYLFVIILVFGLSEQQLYWYEYDVFILLPLANWDSLTGLNTNCKSVQGIIMESKNEN